MFKIFIFFLGLLWANLLVAENCQQGTIVQIISDNDRVNSSGTVLNDAAAVLQQDRFYVNSKNRLDEGDTTDPLFVTKDVRKIYGNQLRQILNSDVSEQILQRATVKKVAVTLDYCINSAGAFTSFNVTNVVLHSTNYENENEVPTEEINWQQLVRFSFDGSDIELNSEFGAQIWEFADETTQKKIQQLATRCSNTPTNCNESELKKQIQKIEKLIPVVQTMLNVPFGDNYLSYDLLSQHLPESEQIKEYEEILKCSRSHMKVSADEYTPSICENVENKRTLLHDIFKHVWDKYGNLDSVDQYLQNPERYIAEKEQVSVDNENNAMATRVEELIIGNVINYIAQNQQLNERIISYLNNIPEDQNVLLEKIAMSCVDNAFNFCPNLAKKIDALAKEKSAEIKEQEEKIRNQITKSYDIDRMLADNDIFSIKDKEKFCVAFMNATGGAAINSSRNDAPNLASLLGSESTIYISGFSESVDTFCTDYSASEFVQNQEQILYVSPAITMPGFPQGSVDAYIAIQETSADERNKLGFPQLDKKVTPPYRLTVFFVPEEGPLKGEIDGCLVRYALPNFTSVKNFSTKSLDSDAQTPAQMRVTKFTISDEIVKFDRDMSETEFWQNERVKVYTGNLKHLNLVHFTDPGSGVEVKFGGFSSNSNDHNTWIRNIANAYDAFNKEFDYDAFAATVMESRTKYFYYEWLDYQDYAKYFETTDACIKNLKSARNALMR